MPGMAAAMGLSLVVGVAIVEALEAMGVDGVKLKWPNNLYYQDKKLAGILVEMSGQAGAAAHLVIGMGINLAMRDNEGNIDQPWISLAEVTGQSRIDRNALAINLIAALIAPYASMKFQVCKTLLSVGIVGITSSVVQLNC